MAIRIESNDLGVFDVLVADDIARDVLRAVVGVKRGVMRRRDERVMTATTYTAVVIWFVAESRVITR